MKSHMTKPRDGRAKKTTSNKHHLYVPFILLASTILTGSMGVFAAPAYAQSTSQSVHFAIAAQPLTSAIDAFSLKTGRQVGYPPAIGRTLKVNAVSGEMAPAVACKK